MTRPWSDEELELALEALATGREDLVPEELRLHALADPELREALAATRALSLDLGMALRDAPTPTIDLDAMVSRAMDAAPPEASRRGLWLAALGGGAATLGMGIAALGGVPTPSRVHHWGDASWTLLAAADRLLTQVPGGWAGGGLALFVLTLLVGLPLRMLSRAMTPALIGLVAVLGTGAVAHAQRFEGEWPEGETISLDAQDEPADQVLQRACEAAGLSYVSRVASDAPVTVHVREVSLRQLLSAVLPAEATARREGAMIVVTAEPPAPAPVPSDPEPPASEPRQDHAPPAAASHAEQRSHPWLHPPRHPVPPIPPAASIGADRVSMGRDVHIAVGEVVANVFTMGGDATVEGEVVGDVVTMGGDAEVTGLVRGDVVTMGGDIDVRGEGQVLGELMGMGGDVSRHGSPAGDVDVHVDRDERGVGQIASRVLGSAARHGLFFLLGVLLLGAFPRRHASMARALVESPARSALGGFLGALATLLSIVACAITLIGIPVAIFLGIAAVVAGCAGMAMVASVVGATLPVKRFQGRPLMQLGLGVGVLWIVSLIPVLGTLLMLLLGFAGFGAVLMTRFGRPADLD